ncbi:glucose dehydrogenase [Pedobacter yulinensis]|uniref:Glucose dehydrogenase n=1 Tax=Pedobacter yulinensis TaxID=2126353 RepID=A0A2T3HLG2_9SPHI|nr:PQQ-dependent sugar dehydrogenase [Pedobacter yulinensis]PST83298.1 glucose dehydrogenase [Pedobacter yulinensis]
MRLIKLAFIVLLFFTTCKKNPGGGADLPDAEIKTRVVASGLTEPWEMAMGPDGQIWFTERGGRIARLNIGNGAVSTLYRIPDVSAQGEGGLLGMALHPDFSNNPYVYVSYNYGSPYRQKVVRFTFSNNTLGSPVILLDGIPAASIHNGSRLLITTDRKLLVTTGDANVAASAQNMGSLSGKLLRLNLDGSIPADNPSAGSAVWSFGHRNAQGLVQVGNRLYVSEHGPGSDDEINLIEKNRNYGWPNVLGYCNENAEKSFCAEKNVAEPLVAWTPTIAPAGLSYYNNDYIPQWRNSLLLAVLKNKKLVQLKLSADGSKVESQQDYFVNTFGRLRAVLPVADGKIYLATDEGTNDKIIEVYK